MNKEGAFLILWKANVAEASSFLCPSLFPAPQHPNTSRSLIHGRRAQEERCLVDPREIAALVPFQSKGSNDATSSPIALVVITIDIVLLAITMLLISYP